MHHTVYKAFMDSFGAYDTIMRFSRLNSIDRAYSTSFGFHFIANVPSVFFMLLKAMD